MENGTQGEAVECACHAHPRVQGMALEDMDDDGGRAREQVALAATCASMGDEPGQSVAVVSEGGIGLLPPRDA